MATATASSERLPELAQGLALLVRRDVRVDGRRDLNVRVGDDLTDYMRRRSKIEKQGDAGMAKI
jgi:hypothetical protein